MRGFKEFTQEDLNIIKELSAIDNETIRLKIADVLSNLHKVNKTDYLEILKIVSKNPNSLLAGRISDAIVNPRLEFSDDDYETGR